jgi:hypothetical protein
LLTRYFREAEADLLILFIKRFRQHFCSGLDFPGLKIQTWEIWHPAICLAP